MKVNIEDYYKRTNQNITPKSLKKEKKSPFTLAEMLYGTFNTVISVLFILLILITNTLKPIINDIINPNFPLETRQIFFLSILILILGILFEIYAIEKARLHRYSVTGAIIFFFSLFMAFSITYIIIKYSLNWVGIQLFGQTEIGQNKWFYLPSIVYLGYSIFNIYYSFALMNSQ
ncbi:hypothetical protein X927_00915 [Petrotoga mexicana DSM 14811]|jgi:hypothetical protein|uniref:Uncharacterized protein n=1 Tax=Petrotoga mexicana DSM 14811 TaxID=1122954 RepID=A0A2K1PF24_9BACT|nr:hypothetical protein [Petrotoga mexicana]PNS01389.1 hypothetical protein X927_00915 [Petrotoga mexicana DSM 14811]